MAAPLNLYPLRELEEELHRRDRQATKELKDELQQRLDNLQGLQHRLNELERV